MICRSRAPFLRVATKNFYLIVAILSVAPAYGTEPSTGPLAGTTAAHNAIRQALNNGTPPVPNAPIQPVACPAIPDFVWDDTVAASAQAWADGCQLGHDGAGNPYGENLSLAGTGYGLTGPTSAISWADEVRNPGYNYATNECPSGSPSFPGCGHYTQVAWATTTKLGCGYAVCGGTEWLVCRYDPGGNVNVQTTRPYCTATQITDCEMAADACGGGGKQGLSVNKDGTGTVSSNPPRINCGK